MDRVIKFRAWHIDKKIMASVGDLNWSGKVHVTYKIGPEKPGFFFGGNNVGDDWEKDEHTLMQFTGLLDKNGKEIYESDVVRFFDGKIISTENGMDVDEIYNIGAFEWDETRMGWYVTNRDSVEMEEISEDIEVIGNLYENPELLSTPSLT